ncbi:shikimate kinase [Salipaludibacillus neizhouensis]|uniref:Shikimate kinase n=1 Tax=Salipaludibacillus neizhouensis TaxID=885475 RepID=A0A3A9KCM0_9BACI|nr:shikimate kinase [Salipaludibacillus neizhouensis]RKL68282.1 shikimate kinase [Salipaludibacillus neizhouensis]
MGEQTLSAREKNVVFIGFMGVGKTTIGELVAEKLSRSFTDIDEEIVKEFNMTIPEIFEKHGEKAFREKEKELTLGICKEKRKIISIGGGAFTQKEIRDICLSTTIVYFLEMSWESWKKRIDILLESRPILQGKSEDDIEKLFYDRQINYNQHHLKYNADEQTEEEIAEKVIESLKIAWEQDEEANNK